jgi:hypothetical protein
LYDILAYSRRICIKEVINKIQRSRVETMIKRK